MMETASDLDAAITSTVRARLVGHPLLEDALQEARIEAWRRREQDPDTPLGHLLVAARRRALDVAIGKQAFGAPSRTRGAGSRAFSVAPSDLVGLDPVEDPYDALDEALDVSEALAALPADQRAVAQMIIDGYKQREVAAAFNRSESWVNTRMLPKIRANLRGAA